MKLEFGHRKGSIFGSIIRRERERDSEHFFVFLLGEPLLLTGTDVQPGSFELTRIEVYDYKKIHHAVTRFETLLHALKSCSTCYLPCYSTSCNLEGIWSDKNMCLWSWSSQSKSSTNLPPKKVPNTSSLAFCFCFQGESVPKGLYHHPFFGPEKLPNFKIQFWKVSASLGKITIVAILWSGPPQLFRWSWSFHSLQKTRSNHQSVSREF